MHLGYLKCAYGASLTPDTVEMYRDTMATFQAAEAISASNLGAKMVSGLGQAAYAVGADLFVLNDEVLYEVESTTATLSQTETLVKELI